jgi:ribonucleotide reductase beta subunit family protein with ferritin-like domain
VDSGEWECALFAQNVMLESMEFVVFEEHSRNADRVTRDVLERILRDERRHLGFGENEIARRIRERPEKALGIATVKQELESLVLETFEHAARELGLPPSESPRLGRAYLAATERLGISG